MTQRFDMILCMQEAVHTASILSVMTDATMRSVAEIHKCRFRDKHEMKLLGATSNQMQWKLQEFIYLGCSKFAEDSLNNANNAASLDLKFWDASFSNLDGVSEVRRIRHISNVIKHNNSIVSVASGSASAARLVNDYGFTDETPLSYMNFCYGDDLRDSLLISIYHCYRFAFSLLIHYGIAPESLRRAEQEDIPGYMLNLFVHELPHHPEYNKEG